MKNAYSAITTGILKALKLTPQQGTQNKAQNSATESHKQDASLCRDDFLIQLLILPCCLVCF